MRFVLVVTLLAGCSSGGSGAPKAPSDLVVQELSGGAHVTWKDNSSDESEFTIERKAAGGAFASVGTVPFDTTAYHDGTVQAGMTYTYRVMAMNASGATSSPTNEVDFTLSSMASMDMGSPDMSPGSSTCHQAGCRKFASYCSTNACTCIALIRDNPDPVCAGTMVTCTTDPCAGKTASCNHGTGQCVLN